MPSLERRVQVLFDPAEYTRLEHEAQRAGQSVGALIRDAVEALASAAQGIGHMPDPDSEAFAEMLDSYWTKDGLE